MIYIIHGDDTISSYKKLQEATAKSERLSRFDCEKNELKDLELLLNSQELFADRKTIVIENPKKIPANHLDEFSGLINKFEKDKLDDIILYSEVPLDDKFLSKFKTSSVISHFLPKLFFQLLDNFSPTNQSKTYQIFQQMKSTTEAEQVFYAMVKRIRSLIMIKFSEKEKFEEISKMAAWQRAKLHKQASLWEIDELLKFYSLLFKTEIDLKSGGIANSLSDRLDNLIASGVH